MGPELKKIRHSKNDSLCLVMSEASAGKTWQLGARNPGGSSCCLVVEAVVSCDFSKHPGLLHSVVASELDFHMQAQASKMSVPGNTTCLTFCDLTSETTHSLSSHFIGYK